MKEATNPAKINLKNVKSFLQGYKRWFSEEFGFLDWFIQEQVIWRKDRAKECVENKACTYCGCKMPEKLYSDIGCEDPTKACYPEMMTEEQWIKYKEDNGIQVNINP